MSRTWKLTDSVAFYLREQNHQQFIFEIVLLDWKPSEHRWKWRSEKNSDRGVALSFCIEFVRNKLFLSLLALVWLQFRIKTISIRFHIKSGFFLHSSMADKFKFKVNRNHQNNHFPYYSVWSTVSLFSNSLCFEPTQCHHECLCLNKYLMSVTLFFLLCFIFTLIIHS